MFPDEYIRYITSLPVEPLENLTETALPKWTILPTLSRDTTPRKTGCKFGKYCREGPQCPYLHPQMDTYNTILGQVTYKINTNDRILYINTTEKQTRRIPSPPSKRESRSRRQKVQTPRRSRSQTIQRQNSDRSRIQTLKRQRPHGLQYQEYDCHRSWIRRNHENNQRIYRSREGSRSESGSRKRSRSPERHEEVLQDIRKSK